MPDSLPAHRAYSMVPLFSPSTKRDELSVSLPDGVLSFRATDAAPAFIVKFSLEGETLEAIMPLHAARMMIEVLEGAIRDSNWALPGEPAADDGASGNPLALRPAPHPDEFVLASVDANGRIAAWTRFHGEDPAFVGQTLLEQGGEGRTLKLMTSEGVCAALAAEAAA